MKRLFLTKKKNFEINEERLKVLLEKSLSVEEDVQSIIIEVNSMFKKMSKDIQELEQNIKKEKIVIEIKYYQDEIEQKNSEKKLLQAAENEKQRGEIQRTLLNIEKTKRSEKIFHN